MDRFWAKVDKSGDCWLWTATKCGGYGQFWHEGRMVIAHRMAWLLDGNELPTPPLSLDHICRNRACVRVDHLRVANQSQQLMNTGLNSANTSGERGVSWEKEKRMWRVDVTLNGKQHRGGTFTDFEEAKAAAQALRERLHGS